MQAEPHRIRAGRARPIPQNEPWWSAAIVALLMLCLAVLSARSVLLYASVCTSPVVSEKETIVAVGILLAGAAFSWASFDMLLVELLPRGMGVPITISVLLSIVLMAAALSSIAIASHRSRLNQSAFAWALVAGALVWTYATFSALGFCVFSAIWLA